eukprot:m.151626 g.151626  ORF g.151626 m.151626 type:complete len:105 (-) comp16343_c0_seq1:956-1270(-)
MAFPLGIGSFCNWRATKKHASKHLTLLFRQALPAGMAVAVVHFHHKNLLMGWRRMLRVGIAIVAMALLLSYAGFAAHCENKVWFISGPVLDMRASHVGLRVGCL